MSESDSEYSDLEEMSGKSEEEIRNKTDYPRCKRCKRFMLGHDKGTGGRCKMPIIEQEELSQHDKMITEIRISAFRRNQKSKKSSTAERETPSGSMFPSPNVSGILQPPNGEHQSLQTNLQQVPAPAHPIPAAAQPAPVNMDAFQAMMAQMSNSIATLDQAMTA